MRTAGLVGHGCRETRGEGPRPRAGGTPGARGVSPRPRVGGTRVAGDGSGVEGEAELARLAVGGVAQAGDGLLGGVVGLPDAVDVAGLLASGDLTAELLGDPHDLLDLLHRGDLLARRGPDGVLVAA